MDALPALAGDLDAAVAAARERWLEERRAPAPETFAAANALFRRWVSQAGS